MCGLCTFSTPPEQDRTRSGNLSVSPSLTEPVDQTWKNVTKFATIDVTKEPELTRQFGVRSTTPYTVKYAGGESVLIPSLERVLVADGFRALFDRDVEVVPWDSVREFLQLSKEHYKPQGPAKFSLLVLRRDDNTPYVYLRKAAGHKGSIKFGRVLPLDRHRVFRYLDINTPSNLLLSYVRTDANNTRSHVLEHLWLYQKNFMEVVNLVTRHSVVGISNLAP